MRFLRAYTWAKSILIAIFLLFLVTLALFSVVIRPYDIIQSANTQRVRGQLIAKDALILESSSNTSVWPQAISELQDTSPLWHQEEAYLLSLHTSNINAVMVAGNADYIAINQALAIILAHRAPADPVQVAIILQHERAYSIEMSQVATLMLQDLDGIQQQIFIFCLIIYTVVMALTIADPFIIRRYLRENQKDRNACR
jgi:hypothetical protein